MYRLTSNRTIDTSQSPIRGGELDKIRPLGTIPVKNRERMPQFQMNEGADSRYRIAMKPTLEKQSERLKNRRI